MHSIFRSKNCLHIEKLSAGRFSICRWQISADQIIICRAKVLQTICRSKKFVLIEELFHLQIKALSADCRINCIWKNYMQIEVQSGNGRSIPSANQKSICRSKNYLHIKMLFADWRVTCRSKNYLQSKKLSTDWKSIWPVDPKIICRSKNYL